MSLHVMAAGGGNSSRSGVPQLLMIGDSRTDGTYNTWPVALSTLRGVASVNAGLTDTTVLEWGATGYVAARCPVNPYASVLVNLGVNDFPAHNKTIFKAAYLSMLDQIVAVWAPAVVYCAFPWKRGFDADADTLAGWIAECIAARSFARAGHDERVWLKGSDDGATMTTDGTHYSAAGELEVNVQWQGILP